MQRETPYSAFAKGREAADVAGVSWSDNPYLRRDCQAAWWRGFVGRLRELARSQP